MPAKIFFIFASFILSWCTTQGEPANVLVGDLTFVRPEKWVWEAPSGKSAAVSLFLVPDASGDTSSTTASFYHGPKNAALAFQAWQVRFPNAADLANVRPEEKTINNRLLTYYTVKGTYAFAGPPRHNHTFVGAVMPSAGKFVHVLLVGPTGNVEAVLGEFKNMVETALKEAEQP